jgi:hypothetical protein
VVLFFLAAIGAGAVVYIKPEYHDKAAAWINQQLKSSKHYLASASDKKPADANSAANKTAAPFTPPQPKPDDASAAAPSTPNTPTSADATANTAPQTSAPAPVVTSTPNPPTLTPTPAADHTQPDQSANTAAPQNPAPTATTAPPPTVAQQTVTPAAPATPSPAQPTASQQTAEQQRQEQLQKLYTALDTPNVGSLPIDQQAALNKTLFLGGITADRNGDLPLAIKCYSKIEELDKSVRNTNVDTYLKDDQEQLPK